MDLYIFRVVQRLLTFEDRDVNIFFSKNPFLKKCEVWKLKYVYNLEILFSMSGPALEPTGGTERDDEYSSSGDIRVPRHISRGVQSKYTRRH